MAERTDSGRKYGYCIAFGDNAEWQIYDLDDPEERPVWTFPWSEDHDDLGEPPMEVRLEYERRLAESGFVAAPEDQNLVELLQDDDADCAWDQPCAYGHRVENHAVYCHNTKWLYAPMKCRRHQGESAWGDDPWPHDGCPGYAPNPLAAPEVISG